MTGAKNTIATMALEALLDLPPLYLYIKSIAFNVSLNIQVNGCWLPYQGKSHTVIRDLINVDELYMHSDQMKALMTLDDKFDCIIPTRDEWLSTGALESNEGKMLCFTDGSKINGLSGAGYLCEKVNLEESIPTGSHATVFQSELFAISELCDNEAMKSCIDKTIVISKRSVLPWWGPK